MEWYLGVWKKFGVLEGRARRKEYWIFVLFNLLAFIALGFIEATIGAPGTLVGLYSLAVLIPSITVGVRRLHDTDRSGWWLLIGLLPLVGTVVLLVFFLIDGTQGENRFGPSPKYSEGAV